MICKVFNIMNDELSGLDNDIQVIEDKIKSINETWMSHP